QTCAVVGEEGLVHQLRRGLLAGDRLRVDARPGEERRRLLACGHAISRGGLPGRARAGVRPRRAHRRFGGTRYTGTRPASRMVPRSPDAAADGDAATMTPPRSSSLG